jgi:hypothetical protein
MTITPFIRGMIFSALVLMAFAVGKKYGDRTATDRAAFNVDSLHNVIRERDTRIAELDSLDARERRLYLEHAEQGKDISNRYAPLPDRIAGADRVRLHLLIDSMVAAHRIHGPRYRALLDTGGQHLHDLLGSP